MPEYALSSCGCEGHPSVGFLSKNRKNYQTLRINPLRYIYFYLTDTCNLNCRHCWISPKFSDKIDTALDIEAIRYILDQSIHLGLTAVKLTGGEPLLHPKILDIIAEIKRRELTLSVETNGVLCLREIAEALKSCKSAFVAVSLDGPEVDSHEWMRGVKGSFDAAVKGIGNLVKSGIRPQVIMSIVKRNKDQMKDLVRLAEKLGASSVKFNIVQPTARGEILRDGDHTLSLPQLVELGRWAETELPRITSLPTTFSHPPAFRPLSRMFANGADGCNVCKINEIIGVLADGSYSLCGIGQQIKDLQFGHSGSLTLKDVWENATVLKQIRAGLPNLLQGICNNCIMKRSCMGNCIAQNYYSAEDLFAPFWYCKEADRLGLFPASRKMEV